MTIEQMQSYILPLAVLGFIFWKVIQTRQARAALPGLKRQGARIVDVRTPAEFSQGHNPESINIPLDQLDARLGELAKDKPLILCCASGGRSGFAMQMLKQRGFQNMANAGAWQNTMGPT